jgi:hypothetical protein
MYQRAKSAHKDHQEKNGNRNGGIMPSFAVVFQTHFMLTVTNIPSIDVVHL